MRRHISTPDLHDIPTIIKAKTDYQEAVRKGQIFSGTVSTHPCEQCARSSSVTPALCVTPTRVTQTTAFYEILNPVELSNKLQVITRELQEHSISLSRGTTPTFGEPTLDNTEVTKDVTLNKEQTMKANKMEKIKDKANGAMTDLLGFANGGEATGKKDPRPKSDIRRY